MIAAMDSSIIRIWYLKTALSAADLVSDTQGVGSKWLVITVQTSDFDTTIATNIKVTNLKVNDNHTETEV